MGSKALFLPLSLCLIIFGSSLGYAHGILPRVTDYVDPSEEAALVRHLLDRYSTHGKHARPLQHTIDNETGQIIKVIVKYGLRLMHIDLNEKDQAMEISTWTRMQWYDEYLSWNVSHYHDIEKIALPHDQIWTPDITLMNTADSEEKSRLPAVQVNNRGSVFWTPHAEFISACQLDITNFPFDNHRCDMWFQSISHSCSVLDLQPYTTLSHNTSLDLSTYLDSYASSQEWEILGNTTVLFEHTTDAGIRLMYSRRPALRFRFWLKRRPGFKAYILTLPCLLLSLLTVIIFCLPPERPDRNAISMSLFTCCLLLLLLLSSEAPPTAASTPKLCYYYGLNMVVIMASVFCSVLVIYINKRAADGCAFPSCLAKILHGSVKWVLCIRQRKLTERSLSTNRKKVPFNAPENWRMLANMLDRCFTVIFIVIAVVALFCFFPWV